MQPEDDDEACALAVLTRATLNGEREQLGLLEDEILFGQGFPHLPVSLCIRFTRSYLVIYWQLCRWFQIYREPGSGFVRKIPVAFSVHEIKIIFQ